MSDPKRSRHNQGQGGVHEGVRAARPGRIGGVSTPVRREVRPTDQPPEGAAQPDARPVLSFTAKRRGKAPAPLADFDVAKRKEWAESLGTKGFRADQMSRQYFVHNQADPAKMTDLPPAVREGAAKEMLPTLVTEASRQIADAGETIKNLWRLYDGVLVESVLMAYPDRVTLCISSQAGCGMACPFCATGQMGLTRNLSTAEIIEQVRHARLECAEGVFPDGPDHLSNVVFMGMGEPMMNYKNVVESIKKITEPSGLGMSPRRITVSTSGIPKMIKMLADEEIKVNLALSLHSAIEKKRNEIMPFSDKFPLTDIMDSLKYWYEKTGNIITFEYCVWKGINDQDEDIKALIRYCKQIPSKVNLIQYNSIGDGKYDQCNKSAEENYVRQLEKAGITVMIRRSRGGDIDAACGQLANKSSE